MVWGLQRGCSMLLVSLLLYVLLLITAEEVLEKSLTASECRDLGFLKDRVTYDSCKELEKYVIGDSELISECYSCADEDAKSELYSRAELQLSRPHAWSNQELRIFINDHADKFKKLKIQYMRDTEPTLVFWSKGSSEVAERVSVGEWKVDSLMEFITKKLKA